jgi:hypothetical protein
MTWWWFSVYDPITKQFQGVILLEARSTPEAMQVAAQLGCRGEIRMQRMTPEESRKFHIPEDMQYRLLTRQEARSLDSAWLRFMSESGE